MLLVCTELTGQVIYYVVNGYPLYESEKHRSESRLFELHPYLVGRIKKNKKITKEGITITSTEKHTRWTGAPKNQDKLIRVAILGGSTTFGTGVTDKDSWPAILQKLLGNRYSVTNYGVPGYSTVEAIIQMALTVPEIRPQIVIFYEGWNDIRNFHDKVAGSDYFSHGMMQYTNLQIGGLSNRQTLFDKIAGISSIFKLTHVLISMASADKRNNIHGPIFRTTDEKINKLYVRNLRTLKKLSNSIDAYAMFIPQVLNYSAFFNSDKSRSWTPFIIDSALPELLDQFNALMGDVCKVNDAHCQVVNEVTAVNWHPGDFIDDGHLSASGGRKFARIVATRIKLWAH